jgi:hypothetical protein
MSRFEQDWKALDIADLPINQQAKLVRQAKKGDVKCVYPMIVEIATASWNRLPPHTKIWYKLEDAINAGVAYTVTSIAKSWDKKRGVKFNTHVHNCLVNFYITQETEWLRTQSRWEGQTFSLEHNYVRGKDGRSYSIEYYVSMTLQSEELEKNTIARLDAQKGFLKVYDAASITLRKYLFKWFLTDKLIRIKDGEEYRAAKREFRKLSKLYKFTCAQATFLATNDYARADTVIALANHVLRVRVMLA